MKAIIKYSLVCGATFISICGLTVGMAKPGIGEIKPAMVAQQSGEVHKAKQLLEQAKHLSPWNNEAISLAERALVILENAGASETTDTAEVLHFLGKLHSYLLGNFKEAEPFLERALVIREKTLGADHPEVAETLQYLAATYGNLGKYTEAETLHRRALGIREKALGTDHPKVGESLKYLGVLFYSQGRLAEAKPFFQRALVIGAEDSVDTEYTNLGFLAFANSGMKGRTKPPEALLRWELAITEEALGADHPSVANILNHLAEIYRQQDGRNTQEASESLRQNALTITEKELQQDLAIKEKTLGTDHPDVADSLYKLAEVYRDRGKSSEAEPLYQLALAIYEKVYGTNDIPIPFARIRNLAYLYRRQKKYNDNAVELLYQRALAIYEKVYGANDIRCAKIIGDLASLYGRQKKYNEAEKLYKRTLVIYEKKYGINHPHVVNPLMSLASFYDRQEKYNKAVPFYKRALVIYDKERSSNNVSLVTQFNTSARNLYHRKKYTEAEALFKRNLAIVEKALGANHLQVANNLNYLATFYYNQGKYSESEVPWQRALAIKEKALGAKHPDVATILNNLATLYQAQDNTARAIEFLTHGMEVEEANLTTSLAKGSETDKQKYMRKFSSITNNIISLHLQETPNNRKVANLALTSILRRKGRILESTTDSLHSIRQNLTPKNQKLLDNLANTRSQLAALIYNQPEVPLVQYHLQVSTLRDRAEELEDGLSRASAAFSKTSQPITIEKIQKLIPPNTALVEIVKYRHWNAKHKNNRNSSYWVDRISGRVGRNHYAAYILHSRGTPQWVDLGEAEPIDKAVAEFRYTLSRPDTSPKQIARTLDKQVMEPIRKKLGSAKHILLSPDSKLNLIPFAALVDQKNQYLIENYTITYLTTGRDLIRFDLDLPSKQPPVLVANPEYDNPGNPTSTQIVASNNRSNNKRPINLASLKMAALPGTKAEAEAIAPMLSDVTLLTESNATENAIKQVNAPEILHIATHGFFLEDLEEVIPPTLSRGLIVEPDFSTPIAQPIPQNLENPLLRSGIALAGFNPRQSGNEDGVMTALEIANLKLGGTKLVVLSACETGVGDVNVGEGVYGLRRALAIAGSESQVISLWKVDDFGTKELMVKYYQRVLNNEGRSEAMRQTQLEMLRTEGYKHPYYWASFIPSGDWREMGIEN
ncbi:CHAT domain-containing protein [Dapis sp. BLCC M126]|uniref:CHAT domain-containing protein n=1 Tax=Dapis sp. BLCC M126 TaxID=3400189 RepID=UPI003CF23E1B